MQLFRGVGQAPCELASYTTSDYTPLMILGLTSSSWLVRAEQLLSSQSSWPCASPYNQLMQHG